MFLRCGLQTSHSVSNSVYISSCELCVLIYYLCSGSVKKTMYQLLVVQALRPDRLLAVTALFVGMVMGEQFVHEPEQELDLNTIVENEV